MEFQEQVVKRARAGAAWFVEGGIDEKRAAVSRALTESVDKARGHQPDWFRESMSTLKPLLESRNCAYTKWLATRKEEDLARFKQVRNVVRKAIRALKWFQSKAEEAERERFGEKRV